MKKYFFVVKNSFTEYFAYRLNFILWRVRVLVVILISFSLWQAIYRNNNIVFGYSEPQILSYIILISVLSGIVLATKAERVAGEINIGTLSNFLIQPVDYFLYSFARDIADKFINTICSFFEIGLLIFIIHPPLIIQTNALWLLMFFIASFIAALLYFEINMILSFVAFWSKETWAPRFIFFILVSFLAGLYFPLDIVPSGIYKIFEILPFTYLIFFPLKIYLGNLTSTFIIKGFAISILWTIAFWLLMKILWKRGLKVYTSEGT